MVLANRKPDNGAKPYIMTPKNTWAYLPDNVLNNSWLADLGMPMRFSDLMVAAIPGAKITHVVTKKNTNSQLFTPTAAVSRDVDSPTYCYIQGDEVLSVTDPTSTITPPDGVDLVVRAMDLVNSNPAPRLLSGTVVEGVTLQTGDVVLCDAKSTNTYETIYIVNGPATPATVYTPGGWTTLDGKKLLVLDGSLSGQTLTITKPGAINANVDISYTSSYNDGMGIGGATSIPGWTPGSAGFPTFAGDSGVGVGNNVESGYTVITLPTGTYTITGQVQLPRYNHDAYDTAVVLSKFNQDTGGFDLSRVAVFNPGLAAKTAYAMQTVVPVEMCLSVSEETASFAIHSKVMHNASFTVTTGVGDFEAYGPSYGTAGTADPAKYDNNDTRFGQITITKIAEDALQVDNDLEDAHAGYSPGYIGMFYHKSRTTNFPSGTGKSLPNLMPLKIDWLATPQNVRVIKKSGKLSYNSYPNCVFPGNPKLSGSPTYPAVGTDYKYQANPSSNNIQGRYFGYINIKNDGDYGFIAGGEEGASLFLCLKKTAGWAGGGDQWRYEPGDPATDMYPLIHADNASTSSAGTKYINSTPSQTFTGFDTLYHGSGSHNVDFKASVDAVDPTTKRKIRLKAGLYAYMLDGWDYDSVTGSFNLQWIHPTRGTESIPTSYLYHKDTDWTAAQALAVNAVAAYLDPATEGYTTSNTVQGPTITAKFPPHNYL
jgi:hypothetical protein